MLIAKFPQPSGISLTIYSTQHGRAGIEESSGTLRDHAEVTKQRMSMFDGRASPNLEVFLRDDAHE